MKKAIITALKIIIPLGIGGYLTWFFISELSDDQLAKMVDSFFMADYMYLFLGLIVMLLSHMSRAYRWKYMLQPLGYQPTFSKMYHSVMIGYLINLTVPRSGEVARAGYYAKYEKDAKFDRVFGTIVVERIIDVVMLGIVVLITSYLQKDLETFNEISEKGQSESSIPGWVYYLIIGIGIAGLILVFAIKPLKEKVLNLIKGVFEGVKTILKLKQRTAYIAHTLFIWVCYLATIWLCSFAIPETANLSVNAVFAAFTVGAIAISASPGGLGLYPLMVSAVLGDLYGIQNAESFSILAWTFLTAFTIVAGLISLFALPFTNKKVA